MEKLITISNKGQDITETNYWDSENAQKGFFFLSWNAGAARLLIPDSKKPAIPEMMTAKEVIITRGTWQDRDALELLFEDYSDAPYSIHLVTEQCDRLIPDTDQGSGFVVALWTRDGKKQEFLGKYRVVDDLPYLKPWSEH